MKALVTGSAGFVGSHFTRHLRDEGWSVLEVDIRHHRDPLDCRWFFHTSRIHFDLVIHCAAVIPHLAEREKNAMPVAGNLEIDAAMFQWAMKTHPSKTVYFSSAAAYPIHLNQSNRGLEEDDIDLDDICQPDSMYGTAKLIGEIQAREAKRQGLDVLVVRPQTGYGTDQARTYPFPSFIDRAKRRCDPFEIWGSGKQERDFIHIDDIVEATMKLLAKGEQGPINLGYGLPIDMEHFAKEVCWQAGYTPSFSFLLDKPEGAPSRYANVERMFEYHLPQVSLAEGIRRALAS